MAPAAPMAGVLSNQLYVDNDQMRDSAFDLSEETARAKRNVSGNIDNFY